MSPSLNGSVEQPLASPGKKQYTNYIAYRRPNSPKSCIGHLDQTTNTITPLTYVSGTPLASLYEVIEIGPQNIASSSEQLDLSEVQLLPPISGRDVLAVGKNYAEHAKEFNSSGYDSSDKVDIPTHPVIFTKRATSIIAHGEDVLPHQGFTESADYEGEIGVIIGKPGFRISERQAMEHVWGYTIINDVTARERQRDHKQFYIGKSPDTFCPMGPIAVPKDHVPEVLEVTTFINGEKRQNATTKDLIFSIPHLIKVMSEGQTLQPGDVLATGTPAGVGFGFRPMVFLKPGDEMKITVTGLGSLINRIGTLEQPNTTLDRVTAYSYVPTTNDKTLGGMCLTQVEKKRLFYRVQEANKPGAGHILFVHGLGGTSDYFQPLATKLAGSKTLHFVDLEGHGLSPTSALSKLTIPSFAVDLAAICKTAGLTSGISVVAHSMGCHVAVQLALTNPGLVKDLVLMGPPPSPLPEAGAKATFARAALVREKGMYGVVDAIVAAGTSPYTQVNRPMAVTATRLSLLAQDPEGYAKACTALAAVETIDYSNLKTRTLLLTGSDDKVSPPKLCKQYQNEIDGSSLEILQDVGHWHLFEQDMAVSEIIQRFLGEREN